MAAADKFGHVIYYTSDSIVSESNITVKQLPHYHSNNMIFKICRWGVFLILALARLIFMPRGSLIFIATNPPLSPIIGYICNRLRGHQYILLYYDIYPEALINFTNIPEKSLICKAWKWMNAISIRYADNVITISSQLENTLKQYKNGFGKVAKVDIIPTWVNSKFIHNIPKSDNWFAKRHGQSDKFTVLYSGNIGKVHDLTMLPRIAERLRDHQDIHFVIVGSGPGRGAIEAECKHRALMNVTFLPPQQEDILPFVLSAGDVSIVSLADGADGVSMPSKTYYSMAAENALLGFSNKGSDLDVIIGTHACGYNIDRNDTERVVEAILKMKNDIDLCDGFKRNGRLAVLEHYDIDVCVPKVLKLMESAL